MKNKIIISPFSHETSFQSNYISSTVHRRIWIYRSIYFIESFCPDSFSQDRSRDAPPGSGREKEWHERGVQYAKRARFPASLNIDV